MAHDDDARSDSSWDVVHSLQVGSVLRRSEDDASSASSWNLVARSREGGDADSDAGSTLEAQPSTCTQDVAMTEDVERICSAIAEGAMKDSDVCSYNCPCQSHIGKSFNDLVVAAHWDCALCMLCTSPVPEDLVRERDCCGDSALSWALYKSQAKRSLACLQLICHILLRCPAEATKRSSNQFLPLHDAAWGNAPAALATLVCAAFPEALHERAKGQTPHEVGEYYHSKYSSRRCGRVHLEHISSFSWPAPLKMMKEASELRSQGDWLQTLALGLASLQRCSFSDLQSLSAVTLKLSLGVPESFAALLVDYFTPRPVPVQSRLTSIPEGSAVSPQRRQSRSVPRKKVSPAGREDSAEHGQWQLDVAREACPKDCGPLAGLRRVRNSRCNFTQLMTLVDASGVAHRLTLHTSSTMQRTVQRRPCEAKWPSKAPLRRARANERLQKTYYDRLP